LKHVLAGNFTKFYVFSPLRDNICHFFVEYQVDLGNVFYSRKGDFDEKYMAILRCPFNILPTLCKISWGNTQADEANNALF